MILSAQSIMKRKIITPSQLRTVVNGKTFGLGAAGYDIRVDFKDLGYMIRRLWIPNRRSDPNRFDLSNCDLEPSFMLASTLEHFTMPDNVMGIVHDKSSWARLGVAVQNTVIEPGWRGYLTLEITMHGPGEVLIHHGDPIAQVVFHQLDEPTIFPYEGKYQDQKRGPQPARDEPS